MILEQAILNVLPDQTAQFELAFEQAQQIISRMPGYIDHELQRCIENREQYLLLVKWETLEDHTVGFRTSAEYLKWKELLHHFYNPFPKVEHYTRIF
ncbi:heme-degrading monooxygenase HmoA [Pedobacter cryoconitis]|uniref:Heme-degrading monooxygenase HmoA n=1 Tax=Pedobacter cryoconitis TaxID=188932 RepID=A0A7W8ZRI6_9SPHI|nr:antibiotic biosynthesis monooxygenase [Pedobacter cryoconitis]MBB5638881.1 heme-degrading monooxygenase HmoA [Pedobacter cryoconitis]MBB6270118.1 heme-degrading monooxygenase HmoA [Pedobacter cryoconitis]